MTTSQRVATADVSHLSQDALDRLRRLLVAESAAQAAQFADDQAMVAQLRGLTDPDSILERELAEAGGARAQEAMTEIEHALQRLETGTYGSCEACAAPIPFERLEAIPSARYCVACPGRRPGSLH